MDGNEIWSRVYGGICQDLGAAVKPTPDQGYILLGYKGGFGFFQNNFTQIIYPHLFKTDSLGLINTSKITGHIFDDFDLDCLYNGEEGQENWMVEAIGNGCGLAALKAVNTLNPRLFEPAVKDGKAVAVRFEIPVKFKLL